MSLAELNKTIAHLVQRGRGILAADESQPTVGKRFAAVGIENTEENRRAYRDLFLSAPGVEQYISGVILFEETLTQKSINGQFFPELLQSKGIVPGIKVDKGLMELMNAPGDEVTQGLDGLGERLRGYKQLGARFTKWRAVYHIGDHNPRQLAICVNADNLARYAAICQHHGFVPIVEPEVLIDGEHTLERCAEVSEEVLRVVFVAIARHGVSLEHMILKPSMVISGKGCSKQASVTEVAEHTIQILRRTVPAAVPSINFLSGGQTEEQSTAHLNAMNRSKHILPWNVSFSYARALQAPSLKIWQGKSANVESAQEMFVHRARLNSAAACGEYEASMEHGTLKK